MGGMKHCPLSQVKTSSVHHNGACSPFSPSMFVRLEIICKYRQPCSTLHWDQTQLNHSYIPEWLLVEYHLDQKGCLSFSVKFDFSALYRESLRCFFTLLDCSCSDILVRIIAEFLSSLFLIYQYIQ